MSAVAVATAGYAPDSVWAEYTDAQREISARMERESNMRRSAVLARQDETAGHPVSGYTDGMLASAAKRCRRELEDIAEGDHHLPAKGPRGVKTRVRFVEAMLATVQREQDVRAALAESWLAAEDGTHSYTDFAGRGGPSAVLHHGATPPSYDLWSSSTGGTGKRGKAHVLGWAEPSTGSGERP